MVQDTEVVEAGTSKETETTVDVEKEIQECMGAGKKDLLCNDYSEAVNCFQEACTLLSGKHGQMAEECCEAYYYYGVSLLELARLENGVLGNALKGVPEEDADGDSDQEQEQFEKPDLPETEREKLREEVEAAMATEDEDTQEERGCPRRVEKKKEDDKPKESEKSAEKSDEKEKEEKQAKVESSTVKDVKDEKSSDKPVESSNTEEPGTSGTSASSSKENESEEDPDDISNMQLAWEMLELAKVLYKKHDKSKTNKQMVAQCHLKLGELGLEVENHPQAIGDFLECLVIQKDLLPETDRKLAETYYNLGLAYSFEKRYDNALEHYQSALDVLEARVDMLNELIESNEGNKEKEKEIISECKEVGELKELIPDINSKIEDVILAKKQMQKLDGSPFRQASEGESSSGLGASTSDDKPCSTIPIRKVAPTSVPVAKDSPSDITHLVRRKRPSPDEDNQPAESKENESKKAKQEETEEATNGHSAVKKDTDVTDKNGTNGHSKTPKKDAAKRR
uniref:Protein HGV2 n=1 Tax=Halocynthia roretzi TaxID=7729 RepID=HGV2_HALRO|nr:RecName: Full=Protein HGV2 [Halocynthia roretzi]BAA02741.1 Hgv2 [Halocynthia roretzi]